MTKKNSDAEVLEAAKTIEMYCDFPACGACIFKDADDTVLCFLRKLPPSYWGIAEFLEAKNGDNQ